MREILSSGFFGQTAPDVAPALLGAVLVREVVGHRLSAVITETEAYQGQEDKACHASRGKTPRTAIMFGEPGRAYIYFTYGMHWLLNVTCDQVGAPAAVLIRAIMPLEGIEVMRTYRQRDVGRSTWLNGPAKLTQALAINGALNGVDLTNTQAGLWIERGLSVPREWVKQSPRIGIDSTPEPWLSKQWRWYLERQAIVDLMKNFN